MTWLSGRIFAGAIVLLLGAFVTSPRAVACDVQLGRPNSCNQYCDGDFIDGPEIISCQQYIRQKATRQEALERAKQERATQERRQREESDQRRRDAQQAAEAERQRAEQERRQANEAEQRRRDTERAAEAERERQRQQAVDRENARKAAEQEERNRQRAKDIEFARQELELQERRNKLAQEEAALREQQRQSKEASPTTSGDEVPLRFPTMELTLKWKVLLGVLLLLWTKYLKENKHLSTRAKWALGLTEAAISAFIGTKDTVNILDGVLIALPFGFEFVWGFNWKASTTSRI